MTKKKRFYVVSHQQFNYCNYNASLRKDRRLKIVWFLYVSLLPQKWFINQTLIAIACSYLLFSTPCTLFPYMYNVHTYKYGTLMDNPRKCVYTMCMQIAKASAAILNILLWHGWLFGYLPVDCSMPKLLPPCSLFFHLPLWNSLVNAINRLNGAWKSI